MSTIVFMLFVVGCWSDQLEEINNLQKIFDEYSLVAEKTIWSLKNILQASKLDSRLFLESTFSNKPILEAVSKLGLHTYKCFENFINEDKSKLSYQDQIYQLNLQLQNRIEDIEEKLNDINSSIYIYKRIAENKFQNCQLSTEGCLEKAKKWLKSIIRVLSCKIHLNCDPCRATSFCKVDQLANEYGGSWKLFCDGVCKDESKDCYEFQYNGSISHSMKSNDIGDCGQAKGYYGYYIGNRASYQTRNVFIDEGSFLPRNTTCIVLGRAYDGYYRGDWSYEGNHCENQPHWKNGRICSTGLKDFKCVRECSLGDNVTSICSQYSGNGFSTLAQALEDTPNMIKTYAAKVTLLKTKTLEELYKHREEVIDCIKKANTFKGINFPETMILHVDDSYFERKSKTDSTLDTMESYKEKNREENLGNHSVYGRSNGNANVNKVSKTITESIKTHTTIGISTITSSTEKTESPGFLTSVKNKVTILKISDIKTKKKPENRNNTSFSTNLNSTNILSSSEINKISTRVMVDDAFVLGRVQSFSAKDVNEEKVNLTNYKTRTSSSITNNIRETRNVKNEKEEEIAASKRGKFATIPAIFRSPKIEEERKIAIDKLLMDRRNKTSSEDIKKSNDNIHEHDKTEISTLINNTKNRVNNEDNQSKQLIHSDDTETSKSDSTTDSKRGNTIVLLETFDNYKLQQIIKKVIYDPLFLRRNETSIKSEEESKITPVIAKSTYSSPKGLKKIRITSEIVKALMNRNNSTYLSRVKNNNKNTKGIPINNEFRRIVDDDILTRRFNALPGNFRNAETLLNPENIKIGNLSTSITFRSWGTISEKNLTGNENKIRRLVKTVTIFMKSGPNMEGQRRKNLLENAFNVERNHESAEEPTRIIKALFLSKESKEAFDKTVSFNAITSKEPSQIPIHAHTSKSLMKIATNTRKIRSQSINILDKAFILRGPFSRIKYGKKTNGGASINTEIGTYTTSIILTTWKEKNEQNKAREI